MTMLGREFYERPTLQVARELLGQRLWARQPAGDLSSGRIVEVEGYLGPEDRASHARLTQRRGAMVPTDRSALMFGPAGHAYVYLIYGMHNCFNIVAHAPGQVGAILVRALEPDDTPREIKTNQPNWRGPGRLCAGLGIDRRYNGLDLTEPGASLFVTADTPVPDAEVYIGARIGVEYAGEDANLPYRFCVRGSGHLSRPVR